MPTPQTAQQIFDQVFLDTRAKLLEVAATLDRIERSAGAASVSDDPRRQKIQQAIDIVRSAQPNRAEQLQLLFSDTYDEQWKRPGIRVKGE